MAVEIGAAYLSLLPDLSKLGAGIRSGAMDAINSVAREMEDRLSRAADRVGDQIGAGVRAGTAEAKSNVAELGVSIAAVGLAAGGIGTAITAGMNSAKLEASLGVSPAAAAAAAKTAGGIYAAGWGESLDEVNASVKDVSVGLRGLSGGADLEGLTKKALAFRGAFGTETERSVNAVAQMIRTGLVKNAKEGFDVLAIGMQNGANKADDLTDTFNEYGTQFRKLGLDGPAALGLISQAVKAGARDSDIAADSLKEFSLRAIDGSKKTVTAYKDLGLNAKSMQAQIAAGGPSAEKGLSTVLTKLKAIKNPADQARIATDLFGTQAEDLGAALFAMNPATATATNGLQNVKGAGDRVAGSMTAAISPMEQFKRQAQASFGEAMAGAAPILTQTLGALQPYTSELTKVGLAVAGIVALNKAWSVASATVTGIKGAASTVADFGGKLKTAGTTAAGWGSKVGNGISTAANVATSGLGRAATATRAFAAAQTASAAASIRAGAATAVATTRTIASAVAARAAAAGQLVMRGAQIAATAAQWLWNAAMTANPIGIVIVAVVALVAAIVLLWNKSETFRSIVIGTWNAIRTAAVAVFGGIKTFIVAVWRGIVTGVTAYVNMVRTVITTVIRIAVTIVRGYVTAWQTIFRVGWSLIVGVVTGAINRVKAIITGIRVVVSIVSSTFSNAKARAVSLLGGLLSFVGSLPGKIIGYFRNIGSRMLSIGGDIVNGLRNGISNAAGRVMDAVSSLVNKIPLKIRQIMGIASPSKVTKRLGQFIGSGLVVGMIGTAKQVQSTAAKLAGYVRDEFKGAKERRTLAAIASARTRLIGLATRETTVQTRLAAATKALKSVQDAYAKSSADTADKVRGLFTVVDQAGGVGVRNVTERLMNAVNTARQFSTAMATLARRGLNKGLLEQLAEAGPEAGLAQAQALAAASSAELAGVNRLAGQLDATAKTTGTTVANSLYGTGVQAAKGLVAGLTSQQKAIDAAALRIARSLQTTIRRELRIKSPSKRTHYLGAMSGAGVVGGLDSQIRPVQRAAARIGSTLQTSMARQLGALDIPRVGVSGTAAGGGPGGDTYTTNVYPQRANFTTADLEAIEAKRDALSRAGRPR